MRMRTVLLGLGAGLTLALVLACGGDDDGGSTSSSSTSSSSTSSSSTSSSSSSSSGSTGDQDGGGAQDAGNTDGGGSEGAPCGARRCTGGLVCCNPSCGVCVAKGGKCPDIECAQP